MQCRGQTSFEHDWALSAHQAEFRRAETRERQRAEGRLRLSATTRNKTDQKLRPGSGSTAIASTEGAVVTELAVTVFKGGRLSHPTEIMMTRDGVADDRRFFVVSTNGKQLDAADGALNAIGSEWRAGDRHLTLQLPDETIADRVELGRLITGRIPWDGNREITGREVVGAWSDALSTHLGEPVHLVEQVGKPALDVAPLTLVSTGSVAALERTMGVADLRKPPIPNDRDH